MPVKSVTTKEELNEILDNKVGNYKYVLLDIYANWCMPCMQFAPKLEELSISHQDNILFIKVDVDEVPSVLEDYSIIKLPTFLIMDKGSRESAYEPIYGTDKSVIEKRLLDLDGISLLLDDNF